MSKILDKVMESRPFVNVVDSSTHPLSGNYISQWTSNSVLSIYAYVLESYAPLGTCFFVVEMVLGVIVVVVRSLFVGCLSVNVTDRRPPTIPFRSFVQNYSSCKKSHKYTRSYERWLSLWSYDESCFKRMSGKKVLRTKCVCIILYQ